MVTAMWYVLRTGCRGAAGRDGFWPAVFCLHALAAVVRLRVGALRCLDCLHIKLHPRGANLAGGQTCQAIGRKRPLGDLIGR
jgi:hypothetical protein